MRRTLSAILLAAALSTGGLGSVVAARADVTVSINPGNVAFGYADGYWDRDHHWHNWPNQQSAQWYRDHYSSHYYNTRHDSDRNSGWHDNDQWWGHDRDHHG